MKLIWSNSGDELVLTPCDSALAEYWVSSLGDQNNFEITYSKLIDTTEDKLREHIVNVHNTLSSKFNLHVLEEFVESNLFDQVTLNRLHSTWIKLLVEHKSLANTLNKISKDLYNDWNQINKKLHLIEDSFEFQYQSEKYWQVENIFGTDILNFNRCHIQIAFSQQGRTTFNKWLHNDFNINDVDTNNYKQMGNELNINLGQPLYQLPPSNYVEFCNTNNIPVVGEYLNLANISTDLTTARRLFSKNQSNTLFFNL